MVFQLVMQPTNQPNRHIEMEDARWMPLVTIDQLMNQLETRQQTDTVCDV